MNTVVALLGLELGLLLGGVLHPEAWWLWPLGAVGGFVLFLALYWVGRLAYRGQEPLARGDITIAAMVGGMSGPQTPMALEPPAGQKASVTALTRGSVPPDPPVPSRPP